MRKIKFWKKLINQIISLFICLVFIFTETAYSLPDYPQLRPSMGLNRSQKEVTEISNAVRHIDSEKVNLPEKAPGKPNKKITYKMFLVSYSLASFVDKTPLKYLSSGYLAEVYARRGLRLINKFKNETKDIGANEIMPIVKKYKTLIVLNDIAMLLNWLLITPIIGIPGTVMFVFIPFPLMSRFLPTIPAFILSLFFIPLLSIYFEAFACTNSMYKYAQLMKKEELELAEIIGNRASGIHAYALFDKIVSEKLKVQKDNDAVHPKTVGIEKSTDTVNLAHPDSLIPKHPSVQARTNL